MRRTHSDQAPRSDWTRLAWMLLSWAILGLWLVAPLAAQTDETDAQDTIAQLEEAADSVVGAAVSVGSNEAALDLELSNGRTVQLVFDDGQVRADGSTLGTYDEGGELDRSWRDLLEQAAMASTAALPVILRDWEPPAGAGALGADVDDRLEQALVGVGGRMDVASSFGVGEPDLDSIDKLEARIRELESRRERIVVDNRWDTPDVVEDFLDGIGMMFATLVWFGVLFGIGSALLFFGDNRLQRISDTVRNEPLRSALIGLAGAFLSIPFYVLVMLALAISILGIPLIIAWGPLFPMLVVLSGLAGWLAVAYGAGDTLVRSRLQERAWFRDAGMFRKLAVGIALLLSPFALGALFEMTSILDWVGGLLFVLGVLTNVLMTAVGFGAVLSRVSEGVERHRDRRRAEKRALAEADATHAEEGTNV